MSKIFTFCARETIEGIVSIKADTLEEAEKIRAVLQENNAAIINTEQGSSEIFIDAIGTEDTTPDDGTHMMQTPADNAEENMEALALSHAFEYASATDEGHRFNSPDHIANSTVRDGVSAICGVCGETYFAHEE